MITNARPSVAVIVVAAGQGTRLGADVPKAFAPIAGRPMLAHALEGVFDAAEPMQVVIVVPEGWQAAAREIAGHVAGAASDHLEVVTGGADRQDSVRAGLDALADGVETVLVHDAARCLTPAVQLERVVSEVRSRGCAVVPGLSVADTIKDVDAGETVRETVNRSSLRAVQTPQGFPRRPLERAYAAADAPQTDDAALVQNLGEPVVIVPGDERAFKVTTSWDLGRVERMLGLPGLRTGIGIDVHAYSTREGLWLAGLHWPGEPALSGHSDGDAVSHAVTDALLQAAGLGDIGSLFGTDDPRYARAHGDVFLRRTRELLAERGHTIVSVSAQVLGNAPRFAPRRREAERLLGGILHAPVTLSATTTDGLGFTGRGEGVTAVATALLRTTSAAAHQ